MKRNESNECVEKLKEEGNTYFKNNDWEQSLKCYTKALQISKNKTDALILYKNRAAVYLKLKKYEEAIEDVSKVLEESPNDPKALYRRCQGLENLNRFEEAYRDARHLLLVDPGNKDIQPILSRLYQKVQKYAERYSDINVKITQMFSYAFNFNEEEKKRETALNNILVLCGESRGAQALFEANITDKIVNALKVEKTIDIRITLIHIIAELCKKEINRTKIIVKSLGIPWFLDLLNVEDETEIQTSQNCLQTIINVLSGMEKDVCNEKICDKNREEIDTILTSMVYMINSRTISGLGRDAVLQLITRNIHFKSINWASRLIEIKGLQRLMEVASELSECSQKSSMMHFTESTRSNIACCLARIYENMYYEKAREDYLENINEFIKSKLLTPDLESKVKVTVAITVLLMGPLEVGNYIMGKDGIMEMILALANSEDVMQEKVACECIVASITKQDKARFIVSRGVDILKRLYRSKDESIRIRALVGLCKAATAGGTDASFRLFADGSTKKMAEQCKTFLIRSQDKDTRRWAAEGFAFLSFDAEVKEMLVEDKHAIMALIEVAKSNVESCTVYAIVNVFVNLCNAYEKKEILPEMIELAKFAKRHIPEEHEFDDEDFIIKRVNILGKLGLTTALVALSKIDSDNCKELICRVFNALCGQQELRGLVVQQGGVKVLIKMAHEGTENGKRLAAQALARVGITMNPEVAFPGERCMEVVRPLVALLHPECSALMNFEALMALCNLASISEKMRLHIFSEKGVSRIESYLFEDHVHLRRAATQCITNLAMSPKLVKLYEDDNDKFKFIFLLCGEEDEETSKAACGAVAILTVSSQKCCDKIFKIKNWLDIFRQILAHPNTDIQLRAIVIVQNILESKKENAEELMSSQVMEILMALSIIHEDNKNKVREQAENCLKKAKDMNIIKENGQDSDEE
ncbi:hypothetical protein PGB90_004463 [Kerria lacca]